MQDLPLDLSYFHALTTESGKRVGDLQPLNGHFLVYKIPIPERSEGGVLHPVAYRRRSVKNVSMILGFVIKASAPWRRTHSRKRMVWDTRAESWQPTWDVWRGKDAYPSDIVEGAGIFYNSYNVGKTRIPGIMEPLVHIRDIDIVATFPIEEWSRVELAGKAMERFQEKYSETVSI